MLNVWTSRSLIDLGVIDERTSLRIALPVDNSISDVNFNIISGNLPPGLRLVGKEIIGTAFEVSRTEEFTFVIRAEKDGQISDRTFVLYVQGSDEPIWITPEGSLNVNPSGQAFILDNSFVDFQLSAIDSDLPAGQTLEFFIQEGDGNIPPGLTLSIDGRITGFVDPILALDVSAGNGFFDTNLYDSSFYDLGLRSSIGFDTFLYEVFNFDYTENIRTPRKISRNYEFIVSVSDGENVVKRKFRIFVVGDDFLRSDNTIMQAGTGVFTADNTFLRAAVWLTPNNLGIRRANNFVTIFLDAYDANPTLGPLIYELETLNDDNTPSVLPPGLNLDPSNGELFGYVPYQPAITQDYKFTVSAIKYDGSAITSLEVTVVTTDTSLVGDRFLSILPLPQQDISLLTGDDIRIGNFFYTIDYYENPPGPNQPAKLFLKSPLKSNVPSEFLIRKTYIRSTLEFNTVRQSKTFLLKVIGEVDSVIKFLTPLNLGKVRVNLPSILSIKAETSVPNAILNYKLIGGRLPPGTSLSTTGEIIGRIRQFGNIKNPGLISFDNNTTSYDGGFTSFDRSYTFDILAQDQFKYSAIVGRFTVSVEVPDVKIFSNIFVKPFPTLEKRNLFNGFINDSSIFVPSKIYRLNDPTFGLQTDLKMLIYAGIETKNAKDYIDKITKNTKKKRFRLGSAKKAVARLPASREILYEVIYIEVFDEHEIGNKSIPDKIKLKRNISSPVIINQTRINIADGVLSTQENQQNLNKDIARIRPKNEVLTIDRNAVHISGRDLEYVYPSSVTNMRSNISLVGDTENAFLPLWMTTPPDSRTPAVGFIKAIPICYCKPGEADFILENIKQSGFKFTDLDYEIDRFIIDVTLGSDQESYLKFPVHKYNV
jgi:hypothetical protein